MNTEAAIPATPINPAVTEISASKALITAGWDDVPHLDAATKKRLLAEIPPHLRDARTKGTPSLGSGAIYPLEEDDFVVDPFKIPSYWPKVFGLDVGWKRTAAIWGAHDRDADVVYLFTEHYRGQAEPSTHTTAIKARGGWIPGVIDPAARGRSQDDGKILMEQYEALGLDIAKANNGVEMGLEAVWLRLATGRLKVFRSCGNWLAEWRIYRRDEKGAIIKAHDHLMDATRYLVVSGLARAITMPIPERFPDMPGAADSRAGY